ncbi:MAG TPA: hypothetical protein VNZ57_10995 [Longimicrobiales bacterium]|nr:hypothetical protein [Longimicrobiales bacterium]
MPGFDKRAAAYAQARSDLLHEMIRRGLFDRDEHYRGEEVARLVRELKERYPDLDDQMAKRLMGEGMQRQWGDAALIEHERRDRSVRERE